MNRSLVDRCLAAFTFLKPGDCITQTREDSMKKVLRLLAAEIRTWAPDPGQARICHLAINEVADRLIRETQELADG
jgi:hypothetical protein